MGMHQIIITGLVMVNIVYRTDVVTKLVKSEDFTTVRTSNIQLTFIQGNLEFIDTLNAVEGTDLEIKNTGTANNTD